MKKLFKNKKILIMGLGLHGGGVGAVKFFAKQGADVLVTDLKTEQQLKESIAMLKGLKIKYALGGHKEADFIWPDLILKNPDVPNASPYLKIARQKKIPIETDLTLFFELSKAYIIGVTGTKGKSTTASLIYRTLRQKYKKVFLGGNIGVSPLEFLHKVKKGDKVVLELSSFELENLKKSPNIAIITNILPDHLNRYASMSEYVQAKKIIFKHQKKSDFLILNNGDAFSAVFAKEAPSKVYFFSKDNLTVEEKNNFKLFGEHNLSNLSAAVVVAKLLKVPNENIKKAIKSFKGVPSRQEFIKEINGVKYFNDTSSTMPESTIVAIKSFSEKFPNSKLILICGGQNKGLNFSELVKQIKEKVHYLIMLEGTASDRIKEGLLGYNKICNVSSMKEAVNKAKQLAGAGDVVALSPAAASFNLFKNEFDRGDQFVKFVKELR